MKVKIVDLRVWPHLGTGLASVQFEHEGNKNVQIEKIGKTVVSEWHASKFHRHKIVLHDGVLNELKKNGKALFEVRL